MGIRTVGDFSERTLGTVFTAFEGSETGHRQEKYEPQKLIPMHCGNQSFLPDGRPPQAATISGQTKSGNLFMLLALESQSSSFLGCKTGKWVRIPEMARGWESKSVEQQQEEMAERRKAPGERASPQQRERDRKRDGLLLSRQRLVQQLEVAKHPRHQEMLRLAIAELEKQLASFE
jgi:hypothetical protein